MCQIKDLLERDTVEADLDAVMEREGTAARECRCLPSHTGAVTAFLEKRQPVFSTGQHERVPEGWAEQTCRPT